MRLARNPRWGFAYWSAVLLRFERELAAIEDDDDFRRFRRTLWERIHD